MNQTNQFKQRLLSANSKVKIIAVIVIVALGAFVFHSYQSKRVSKVQRAGDMKPMVEVLTVQRKDMVRKIELTGQTVPEAQIDIAAKYSGKIVQVNVQLGERVSPGQVLIVQDTSDVDISLAQNSAGFRQASADAIESNASFEASYQRAQADYQHSLTNYERYNRLYEQGAISREALDNMQQQMTTAKAAVDTWAKQITDGSAAAVQGKLAARDKAQSAVDALNNQRNDLVLRAPRGGIIGYRQAEAGNLAQAGQKLLSIFDNSNIYVDFSVSEQDIGQIVLGMPIDIAIDSLGKRYSGKITYISPAIDSKNQAFGIRVTLDKPDESIKAGMFARTDVSVALRPQALFVPKEAVLSVNGKDRIFIVDANNQVTERVVAVGLRNDKSIEILNGLNEGEQVAITNLARLRTGITIVANAVQE